MISYKDLGLLILFLILSGLGIYTFIMLNNLIGVLKRVRELLERNSSNIDKTMDKLPSIVSNVDCATATLKEEIVQVSEAVGIVSDTVAETVLSVNDGAQEAVEYLKIISDVIKILMNAFMKNKKTV